MIPVSDDFTKFIYDGDRQILAKAEADLTSGAHLTLDDYDLLENGFEVEDAVSESDRFQIGAAIINQLTLTLNNFEDKTRGNNLTGCDFTGSVLHPYVGLVVKKDWHGDVVEWIPKGVFTAQKPTAAGSLITVTALDNMAKLDVAYSKSTLAYPATLGQIAADACAVCGVKLATTTFPNSDYVVTKRPTGDSITCREILSYAAQLAGCFARCNTGGAVEIRWYAENGVLCDVGTGTSSSSTADTDTVVTGVQIQGCDDAHTVYSSGTDGYAVRIQDNPLAQDGLQAVANTLGAKFNGYTFRAYTVSSISNPAIEAGDVVNMTDDKGVVHKTILSRLTYQIDGSEEYNGDAEAADENKSQRFTAAQKAQEAADTAQQTANDAKQEIELANVKIGNLTVRVTATEEGLESKVSKDDMSSEIQQHPADVVFAFNNINGSTQSIKFTGDGFDFYNGGTLLGHMGVAYDSEASGYEFCVQPVNGKGTYFTNKSGYSMICMGAIKGESIAARGLISTDGEIQGAYKATTGDVGKTEDVTLMDKDGKPFQMEFKDGLYTGGYH